MDGVTSDWEDPGRFPPQGGPSAGKNTAGEEQGRYADLSAAGRINEVSGAGGGGDGHSPLPEYRCPVYCHSADTGAISGGGETAMGEGVDEMVGKVQTQPRAGIDGDGDRDGYG